MIQLPESLHHLSPEDGQAASYIAAGVGLFLLLAATFLRIWAEAERLRRAELDGLKKSANGDAL